MWFLKVATLIAIVLLVVSCGDTSTETHIQRADAFLEQKEVPEAIIELKAALRKDELNPLLRFKLGEALYYDGEFVLASDEFERALEKGYEKNLVVPWLLNAYIHSFRYEDAFKLLDELTEEQRVEVVYQETKLAIFSYKLERAELILNRLKNDPKISAQYNYLNALFLKAKKASSTQILTAFDKSLTKNPNISEVWLQKGLFLLDENRLNEAEIAFKKSIDVAFYWDVLPRISLIHVYFMNKDFEKAENELNLGIEKYKDVPLFTYFSAVIQYHRGNYENADKLLEWVIKKFPSYFPAVYLHAEVKYELNKLTLAQTLVNKLRVRHERNKNLENLQARIFLKEKKAQKAAEALAKFSYHELDLHDLFLLAESYMNMNDPVKASEVFELASKREPSNKKVQIGLALSQLYSGKDDAALAAFKVLKDNDNYSVVALSVLVHLHLGKGEFNKSLEIIESYIKDYPNSEAGYHLKALVFLRQKQYDLAREWFNKAEAFAQSSIPAINLAILDILEGHLKSAKNRLEAILKEDRSHIRALLLLADVEEKRGEEEKAYQLVKQAWMNSEKLIEPKLRFLKLAAKRKDEQSIIAIEKELVQLSLSITERVKVYGALVSSFIEIDKTELALQHAKALESVTPMSPSVLFLVASLMSKANQQLEEANERLEKALEFPMSDRLRKQILNLLAYISYKRGKYIDFAAWSSKLCQDNDKVYMDECLLYQGHSNVLDRKFEEAIEFYKKSIALGGKEAVFHLFRLYSGQKKIGEAKELLEEQIELYPEDIELMLRYGFLMLTLSDNAKAIIAFEKVVALDEESFIALNNLAWLHLHNERMDEALAWATKAYTLYPKRIEIMDTYAWVLINNGMAKKAVNILLMALSTSETPQPEVRYHLAKAYEQLNFKQKALQQVKHSLVEAEKLGIETGIWLEGAMKLRATLEEEGRDELKGEEEVLFKQERAS